MINSAIITGAVHTHTHTTHTQYQFNRRKKSRYNLL